MWSSHRWLLLLFAAVAVTLAGGASRALYDPILQRIFTRVWARATGGMQTALNS